MGSLLRSVRESKGMTQEELSLQSGVSQSTISAYERGERSETMKTLRLLAVAMGVEPADLIDEGGQNLDLAELIEAVEDRVGKEVKEPDSVSRLKQYLSLIRTELDSLRKRDELESRKNSP